MAKIPKDMNVGDLLGLQKRMENRIAAAIQDAFREFEDATGMTPSNVSVYLVAHQNMGDERPNYLVGQVKTDLGMTELGL